MCFNHNNISAVLVTGGVPTNSVGTSVELLSSNGTRLCSLPNLPAPRHYHSQSGLLSCGGGGSHSGERKSCVTFTTGHWKKTHTLALGNKIMGGHSAWASPRGVLIIGIGNPSYRGVTTTELLTDNGGSTPSFTLVKRRFRYSNRCAIDDGEEVVLTGGWSPGTTYSTVTRYNMQGQATSLPSLNTARYDHACGTIKKSDGATVISRVL